MSVLSFPATQQQCIYLIQKTAERTIYSSKLKEILYEIMFDVPLQSSDSETKKKKKLQIIGRIIGRLLEGTLLHVSKK